MKPRKNLPLALPTPDLVKICPELAVACNQAGQFIFDAFTLWLELRCLDQALMGGDGKKGYRSGQLPYWEARIWLWQRGWNITKVEGLVRGTSIFFKEVYRWPKPPILRLRSFERVCRHFHVIPLSWRHLLLSEFTKKRRSAVRAVMTLPATDAPPKVWSKPRPRETKRANTGIPLRTQYLDKIQLGIKGKKNWRKNTGDDYDRYPVHQIANSHEGFGLSGRLGRVKRVQVAMLGTRCLSMGAKQILRLLRQPWPKRYFETQDSLQRAQRKQDEQDSKGVPSGLTSLIIPRLVDKDALFQVPRSDRLRLNAREWSGPSEEVVSV